MEALFQSGYFALFLIITIGIVIGRVKIKGISLDLSAVIFVALVFGHFGVEVPDIFQKIGLLLFIYSIGIQAGPGFFGSFRHSGKNMIIIAVALVVSGALTALLSVFLLDIDSRIAVGLFAGALTSTPGLAAAIESSQSHLASIGYGIAYPFGVIGVILFMNLIPRLFKINIKKQEQDYQASLKAEHPEINFGHFVVENTNIEGKTIEELQVRSMTGATISRVLHRGAAFVPKSTTVLHKTDVVRAVGTAQALEKIKLLIGKPTTQKIVLKNTSEVQWVLATNKRVINKTLSELQLFDNYDATVTRIRRSGIDITPRPSSTIRFGDKLLVACQGNIKNVAKFLGNEEKRLSETDILPIAAGIVLGILLGSVPVPLPGGLEFKLGLTGGVLIVALVLSKIGKTGNILWNVSGPANQLMRQLGLLFFLAAVGTHAGENLMETIATHGTKLFLTGITITILPMLIALLIGHFLLRLNFLSLLGTLTGGMTSTPGLTAIDSLTESEAPSIAYATVYPVAMVVLIVCTQVLSLW